MVLLVRAAMYVIAAKQQRQLIIDHAASDPLNDSNANHVLYALMVLLKAPVFALLIRILPGCFDGPIKCAMFEASLKSLPPFEALSYVWGSPIPYTLIEVNQKLVPVGENLASALQYLRTERGQRTMWIDALCINQGDHLEKSQQIMLMGSIYSSALQVIVWLGEGSIINSSLVTNNEHYELIPPEDPSRGSLVMIMGDRGHTMVGVSLSHITDLFDDPWWGRIWTLQEAVLAQRLTSLRGRRSLSEISIRYLQTQAGPTSYDFGLYDKWNSLDLARRHRRNGMFYDYFEASFLGVLATQRHRACKEPKDRLYGLLALAAEGDAGLVVPDYSLSDSVVFSDFAYAYMQSRNNLDSLSVVSLLDSGSAASWAIDWDASHRLVAPDVTTISGRMAALKRCRVLIDHVDLVNDIEWSQVTSWSTQFLFIHLVSTLQNALKDKASRPSSWFAEVIFCLMLSCTPGEMSLQGDLRVDGISQYHSVSYDYGKDISTEENRTLLEHLIDLMELMDLEHNRGRLRHNVYTALFQRSLISTKTGYVGLGPQSTQEGDMLVILDGGRVPYILRPEQGMTTDGSEKQCWSLVGDSCINGLMHGEVEQLGRLKQSFILT